MGHPVVVGMRHGAGHLADQMGAKLRRHPPFRQALCQRRTVDEVHGDERLPQRLADFVDGDDARMVQAGRRFRLALEPGAKTRRGEGGTRQHFDRHDPVQPVLSRPIHHPHPAAGDFA